MDRGRGTSAKALVVWPRTTCGRGANITATIDRLTLGRAGRTDPPRADALYGAPAITQDAWFGMPKDSEAGWPH